MSIRGVTYALWIHYSVVLIKTSSALINQYVASVRKIVCVLLSFLLYNNNIFTSYHSVGLMLFTIAVVLKIYTKS